MMEPSQSQTLDASVLEAAASMVAEQMLPHHDSGDIVATENCNGSLSATEDVTPTTTTTSVVVETPKESPSSWISPAQARKRRKEILSLHRKSNELEHANNAAVVNAVLDDPSVEAALAYKRKHEAISKATEPIFPELTVVPTATETAITNVTTAPNPNAGTTSIDSSAGSCDESAPTAMDTGIPSQHMLNAVTTDSKSKKTQIRYEPTVPMDKDQLTAWRREARRVRNRESAAASRMKTKERIQELEEQVGDWKQKYLDAMDRLKELEGQQH